ncbi:MAG: CdaR family protein [Candidatus Binatia bacterium]
MNRLWNFWEQLVALAGSNLGLKFLAVVIAVGLWLSGHRDIERAIEVPVEFRNIPTDLMVTDNRVDYVVLRLMGPRTLVSTLDPDDMKLSLDLNAAKPGSAIYQLHQGSFHIPRGVTVARITPPVIQLRLEPLVKRMLPVSVQFSSKPPFGYAIADMQVEPENVLVQGPADDVRKLARVETVPFDLNEKEGTIKRKVRLSSEGMPLSFTPEQIEVSVTLEQEQISREFNRIAVSARDFSGRYSVTPRSVYLRLFGPKRVLGPLEVNSNRVYLNLKGLPVGEHTVPLTVNLPPEVELLEQKPEQFQVRITETGS